MCGRPVNGHPGHIFFDQLPEPDQVAITAAWAHRVHVDPADTFDQMTDDQRWETLTALKLNGGGSSYAEEVERIAADADPATEAAFDALVERLPKWARIGQFGDLVVTRMSDVEPEDVRWLWGGRIPLGKLTVLEGDPKGGKSTLTLDLMARVTTGGVMPDGSATDLDGPAYCVLMTAEDGLADTVRPRLDLAGADPGRVTTWEAVMPADDDRPELRLPSLPLDVDRLEVIGHRTVRQTGRGRRARRVPGRAGGLPPRQRRPPGAGAARQDGRTHGRRGRRPAAPEQERRRQGHVPGGRQHRHRRTGPVDPVGRTGPERRSRPGAGCWR